MNITFLKDMGNNYFVDAVIISNLSTEKEIQEALHCQVIRGTLVERNVLSLNSKNE